MIQALNSGPAVKMLVLVSVLVAAFLPAATAQDSRAKTRKQISRLQDKKKRVEQKIAAQEAAVEKQKAKIAKEFARVSDAKSQQKMGVKIEEVITVQITSAEVSPESIMKALAKDLRQTFGKTIYGAAERQLTDMIAGFLEDEDPPPATRCARRLKEAFEGSFDIEDFEAAWTKNLKNYDREAQKLATLEKDSAKIDRDIKDRQRTLTADISGRVPRGMVLVPGFKDAVVGITTDEIIALAKKNNDNVESTRFLFWGSQTEKKSVDSFLMDQYEVTHRAYWWFVKQTGHRQPEFAAGRDRRNKHVMKPVWPDDKIPEGWDRRPMTYVSFEDALAYARWTGCRLPTEDEWEIAARSGPAGYDGRVWPWGSEYVKHRSNDSQAHDVTERKRVPLKLPKELQGYLPAVLPVGFFENGASPLGLYDMVGNVSEWTSSPFLPRKTFTAEVSGVSIPSGNWNEELKVLRGGHCDYRELMASSVSRIKGDPLGRYKFVGLRRVRSGIPGLDLYDQLDQNGRLDIGLQIFKKLRHDEKKKYDFPKLDLGKGRFAQSEKLEWNQEYDVPGKSTSVLIMNRELKDVHKLGDFKRYSKGEDDKKDACLIGLFYNEIPIVEPPLPSGIWFVGYKEGRKAKDEKTGKSIRIKDAFVFVPLNLEHGLVRMEASGSEVINLKGRHETKIEVTSGSSHDTLDCIWSFPKGSSETMQVNLSMKVAAGALAGFE